MLFFFKLNVMEKGIVAKKKIDLNKLYNALSIQIET